MKKEIKSYHTVRPSWDSVIRDTGCIQCSCGQILKSVGETRQHWQDGHFDKVVNPIKEVTSNTLISLGALEYLVKTHIEGEQLRSRFLKRIYEVQTYLTPKKGKSNDNN